MTTGEIDALLEEIKKEFEESDKRLNAVHLEDGEIPEDTSLIQNRCDFICNDLKQLKHNISDRLLMISKHEFVMNLLNYKLYEIQYNFSTRIRHLKEVKRKLENSDITPGTESKIAMKYVENEKKITDCELTHEDQHKCVRQQMLDAQEAYENSLNILDDTVEIMKKNFDVLVSLIKAHKHQTSGHSKLEQILEIDDLRAEINKCVQLQAAGWKAAPQDITEFTIGHGLRLTEEGLFITEDGTELSYDKAVELKLFDNVKLVDLFRIEEPGGDSVPVPPSKESTLSSEEKMSSEDVNYLKDCLGIPLTLALAEITAVQPRDPIHYLGHWLFKYCYNEQMSEAQAVEVNLLTQERERLARDRWKKFLEEEARAAVLDMIVKAEEEAIRNELRRIELEQQVGEEGFEE